MAAYDRIDRISEEVRRALDKIIREDVRDPRVCGTFSIVRADVTRDLKFCTVRVSVLENHLREPLIAALKKAAGFVRRELGRRVQLRCVPELIFELDTNIEYAARISEILKNSEGKVYGFGEKNEEN
jgi:ribosome-binding factor A